MDHDIPTIAWRPRGKGIHGGMPRQERASTLHMILAASPPRRPSRLAVLRRNPSQPRHPELRKDRHPAIPFVVLDATGPWRCDGQMKGNETGSLRVDQAWVNLLAGEAVQGLGDHDADFAVPHGFSKGGHLITSEQISAAGNLAEDGSHLIAERFGMGSARILL